jgi:hypothetical protein
VDLPDDLDFLCILAGILAGILAVIFGIDFGGGGRGGSGGLGASGTIENDKKHTKNYRKVF